MDRIDYANDTATAVAKGPLSVGVGRHAATGNANFGYIGGGYPAYSTVERIDYSNDTATAAVKGPLTISRNQHGGTGNANFGYFGGGDPSPAIRHIDRIDYSNDTATAVARANAFSFDKNWPMACSPAANALPQ